MKNQRVSFRYEKEDIIFQKGKLDNKKICLNAIFGNISRNYTFNYRK